MIQTFTIPESGREGIVRRLADFLVACLPGKKLTVEVDEFKRKRSNAQNSFLWSVVYGTMAKATGQEAADWHEFFLGEHYGWERVDFLGKPRMKPKRRSSNMSSAEFADHVAFIQTRAAEFGIFIPDPNA